MSLDTSSSGPEASRDRKLAAAIDEYVDLLDRGGGVTVDEWVARHADLGEELRDCLEALSIIRSARAAPSPQAPEDSSPPRPSIPGYSILEEAGRGGMGVVYKAVQHSTRRSVALKILAHGVPISHAARRRFEREVELAALLDHPCIVQIFDSGQAGDVPYCAMEYVDGEPLHQYLARARPPLQQRIELFNAIADAVHFAHQRAVVHRDLKPSNIMIDRTGRPRILDFGLARLAETDQQRRGEASLLTGTGQVLGTLPYLSPEQASGEGGTVDVRCDIYSLGVLLYEMLAGRPPHAIAGGLGDALHAICHEIPPRPSQFNRELSADLDAVVLKCLEKAKEDRYQSAADLTHDLTCCLHGEPPEASRTAHFYLLRKAYARHRRQVQVGAAGLALVFLSSLVVLRLYLQVLDERGQLRQQLHATCVQRGAAHLAAGHDKPAENILWPEYAANPDAQAYWSLVSYYVQNPLEGYAARCGWVTSCDFSQDGQFLAWGNLEGEVALCDAETLALHARWAAHPGGVRGVAFVSKPDPPGGDRSRTDGLLLVTCGDDGRLTGWRFRDSMDGPVVVGSVDAHSGGVTGLGVNPSRDLMATTGADGRARFWKVENALPQETELLPADRRALDVTALCLSASKLAAATGAGSVLLFGTDGSESELDAGSSGGESTAPSPIEAVAISPDEKLLVCCRDGRVEVWDRASRRRLWHASMGLPEPRPESLWEFPPEANVALPSPHIIWRPTLRFSDDGALLACTGWDASVRVWRAADGRAITPLRAHATAIYALAFVPDTHRLATGAVGEVRVFDLDQHPDALSLPVDPSLRRECVAITPDGRWIARSGDREGTIVVWRCRRDDGRLFEIGGLAEDRSGPCTLRLGHAPVHAIAFDASGRKAAAADAEGNVALWRTADLTPGASWRAGGQRLSGLAFSPDGSLLACGGHDGRVELRKCADGSLVQSIHAHAGQVLCLAFAPDGETFASGGTDWWVRVWKRGQSRPQSQWRHGEWVNAVVFDPVSGRVASAGADLVIDVHDRDGRRVWRTQGDASAANVAHAHWITSLAFLEEGRVIVSGGYDGALRLSEADTGRELAVLRSRCGPVHSLAVDRRGETLVIGASNGVQIVDLAHARNLIERHSNVMQLRLRPR